MENNFYINLGVEYLNNNSDKFKELDFNPINKTNEEIKEISNNLYKHGHISLEVKKCFIVNNIKLGKFNYMPKLHKNKFGIRPVISQIRHPTSNVSNLINLILQPIVIKNETYLRNSQNLIQLCKDLKIKD